jgi:hypothetical protein
LSFLETVMDAYTLVEFGGAKPLITLMRLKLEALVWRHLNIKNANAEAPESKNYSVKAPEL